MVVVECPNCENDVELDSDESGTYECPKCSEEFEHIGMKVSDDNLKLIGDIQKGSYDEYVLYQKYKYPRNYKWYYCLLCIVLIPTLVGIFMLLVIFWNSLRSRTSQTMIVFLPDSNCVFTYRLIHSDPYELKKLHVDTKMKISYEHHTGGSDDNSWCKYKIKSSNGEEIKFIEYENDLCNIQSFGNRMGIMLTQVDKIS